MDIYIYIYNIYIYLVNGAVGPFNRRRANAARLSNMKWPKMRHARGLNFYFEFG